MCSKMQNYSFKYYLKYAFTVPFSYKNSNQQHNSFEKHILTTVTSLCQNLCQPFVCLRLHTSLYVPVTESVEAGHSLKRRPLLLFLGSCSGLPLFEEQGWQRQGGLLEETHHHLIQRVFVLLQPASDVVAHL